MNLLTELTRILGIESALKFIQRFGGTAIYIPHNQSEDHPITLILGPESAKKLASNFAGETLYLPLARKWLREQQKDLIFKLKAEQEPINQIAKTVGCTARWVRMVLNEGEK